MALDMLKISERFEKIVSSVLLVFAMVIIGYQVVQLIWNSALSFMLRFQNTGLNYNPEYGRTIAILFFNVLLMIEIMQTIKVFSDSHINKVKIILIVCLIAASRKVLAMGEEPIEPASELALAGLILSLAAGYFLVSRKSRHVEPPENNGARKDTFK